MCLSVRQTCLGVSVSFVVRCSGLGLGNGGVCVGVILILWLPSLCCLALDALCSRYLVYLHVLRMMLAGSGSFVERTAQCCCDGLCLGIVVLATAPLIWFRRIVVCFQNVFGNTFALLLAVVMSLLLYSYKPIPLPNIVRFRKQLAKRNERP